MFSKRRLGNFLTVTRRKGELEKNPVMSPVIIRMMMFWCYHGV